MKKIAASICVLAMAGMLAACGNKDTAAETANTAAETANTAAETTNTAAETTENHTDNTAAGDKTPFTVGFDAEFPPYGFMDENGEYVGFDLDLAKEVCARNNWKFFPQPIDWDAKDMELESGSIDCIWNGFTMQGREDKYTWSIPYVDNSQVFVTAADAGIAAQADLAGKTVGVQKGSSALAALEGDEANLAATFKTLQQYSDYNVAFMDLKQGAIDALAIDIGVAHYQISSRGDKFIILEESLVSEQYGIGFELGNEELKNKVEKTLLEMAEDGSFMKIAEKYSDYGLTENICLGNQ